jgi:hypothetical protein
VGVDVAGGHCLYGQGLYADPHKRSWTDVLASSDLSHIPLTNYRVLTMHPLVCKGMGPRVPDGKYAGEESEH